MRHALAGPAPGRHAVLAVLQEPLDEGVALQRITRRGVQRAVGHAVVVRRIGGAEVRREDLLVLDRRARAKIPVRMRPQHARHRVEPGLAFTVGLGDGGRAARLVQARRRRERQCFPEQRHAAVRILAEQAVHHGCAGARVANHEDRSLDRLLGDVWMALQVAFELQAFEHAALDLRQRRRRVGRSQRAVVVEGVDQVSEAAAYAVVDEAVKPAAFFHAMENFVGLEQCLGHLRTLVCRGSS